MQIFNRAFSAAEIPNLVNHAPSLAALSDVSILAGRTMTITNTATDPDLPAQTLSFSLSHLPDGATIDPQSGLISWRPKISQAGTNYSITVRVADNGTPVQSDAQTFNVAVSFPEKPSLNFLPADAGEFKISVAGDVGPDYSIYASTNLALPDWSLLLKTNPADLPFSFTDTATGFTRRFYRVQLGP